MNYYIKGDAAKADQIKAAFEKLGIDVLDFGFADKTVVYCSIGGACVQSLPYSINLMHILHSHPDYKELELPVEHKFEVGDWLVYNDGNTFAYGSREVQIKTIENDRYFFTQNTNGSRKFIDNHCRLWTIQDAKDCDLLYSLDSKQPFIYKVRPQFSQAIGYCCINKFGDFAVWDTNKCIICTDKYIPATKEQRDLLFQKMKEAGYEWDADKKELLKIKHYAIANFQPFDKVLVRDTKYGNWNVNLFSYYIDDIDARIVARFHCINSTWIQCIPYNDKTKHLLGTTDMCPDEYINW